MKTYLFILVYLVCCYGSSAQQSDIEFSISAIENQQDPLLPFVFKYKFKANTTKSYSVIGRFLSIIHGFEYKLHKDSSWHQFEYPKKYTQVNEFMPIPSTHYFIREASCTGHYDAAQTYNPPYHQTETYGYLFPIKPIFENGRYRGFQYFFNEYDHLEIRAFLKLDNDDFKYYSNTLKIIRKQLTDEDLAIKRLVFSDSSNTVFFIPMMMSMERQSVCNHDKVVALAKEIILNFPRHPVAEYARLYLIAGLKATREEKCTYFESIKSSSNEIVKYWLIDRKGKFATPCIR
jgi:hypothetical protein